MEDEGSTHSEGAAKKTGFEDDVVSWRSLTGPGQRRCLGARGRPVVLSEHEGREVDFTGELEEAFHRAGPRIEGRRPGFWVCNVFEAACQLLKQLLLFSRRAQEDARLVHRSLLIAVGHTGGCYPRSKSRAARQAYSSTNEILALIRKRTTLLPSTLASK